MKTGESCFDGHAFIFVGNFNVVDVHVETRNIDTVKSAFISSSNTEVINFTMGASNYNQVESGGYIGQLGLSSQNCDETYSLPKLYRE